MIIIRDWVILQRYSVFMTLTGGECYVSPAAVLQKYEYLRCVAEAGMLVTKLAREAFFLDLK